MDRGQSRVKQWIDKIRAWKKEQILILLLFGLLLLIIALPTDEKAKTTPQTETDTDTDTDAAQEPYARKARELEARLEQILAQVEGIGKTEVMLTLKSNGRKIVEKDTEQSLSQEQADSEDNSSTSQNGSESTVFQKDSSGNETPYVTEELEPEITGVLVIAQGAGDSAVVMEITEAVMALFGIEAHKIKVMKME